MGYYTENFKVSYLDVNPAGNLTPKGVIKYLQDVANHHSEDIGYGYTNITKTNLAWVILNWKVNILKNVTVADTLYIKTWPRSFSKAISYREFEIYDSNNNLICIATSKWALTNYTTHSLERIPEEMTTAYGIVDKSVFKNISYEKFKEPASSELTYEYTIQRRDIDTNHHVNNLCYLDFAFETLPEKIYNSLNINNVEILYKKEIKYKDTIKCFYSYTDNKHVITIKNENSSIIHAIIALY